MPPVGGFSAVFEPREHDVVSTKLRSWNLGHPGNLTYAELLVDYALKLPLPSDTSYSSILNQTTKELIERITEKGGRFLKIAEGENHPDDCIVMDYRACHHKVLHGLKNKQRVILTKGVPPKPTKKMDVPGKHEPFKASPRQAAAAAIQAAESIRTTKRVRKPRSYSDEAVLEEDTPRKRRRKRVVRYEAVQRPDGMINHYALELLSLVCNNQKEPLLEMPGPQYPSIEEEPERERRIRLQLRHRLLGALAMKMPVTDFAKKLMEVWGSSLVSNSVLVHRSETGKLATSPHGDALHEDDGPHEEDSSPASKPSRRIPQKEPRKMPQKEPRRLSVDNAPFASLLTAAAERLGDNTTTTTPNDENNNNNDDGSSSSGSRSSGTEDSDGEDGDSDSDSSQDKPSSGYAPMNQNSYGYYNSGYQRGDQSGSEGSGSEMEEDEGDQEYV